MGGCSQTSLSFSFLSVTTPINTPSLFCPLQLPSWDTSLSVFLLCFPTTFKTHLDFFLFCFCFFTPDPFSPTVKIMPTGPISSNLVIPQKWNGGSYDTLMLYTVFICSTAVHSSNTFSQQYTDRLFIHSGDVCVRVGWIHIMEELVSLHSSISSLRKNLRRVTTGNRCLTFPSKVVARQEERCTPV